MQASCSYELHASDHNKEAHPGPLHLALGTRQYRFSAHSIAEEDKYVHYPNGKNHYPDR